MHTNHDLPKPEGLFERIIQFSIQNAIWVMLFVCTWIAVGVYSYQKLPIDAVPDITNTQVQINTQANGFTALEVEQRITYPIETAMAGIPDLQLTRSISRYGLSQVTIGHVSRLINGYKRSKQIYLAMFPQPCHQFRRV